LLPTMRLTIVALILALLSLVFAGWVGNALMFVAMVLALWGVVGYVRAWRHRSMG
jgi:hypothetical protein